MGKLLAVTAAGVMAMAVLGACGTKDEPASPPPTHSSTPSPTASPMPTAPVMPEAAKAHTKEGAEEFVRYFWDVVNYAQATGDTSPIVDASADGCKACDAGVAGVEEVFRRGGRYIGGEATVERVSAELLGAGEQLFSRVVGEIDIAGFTIDLPEPAEDTVKPAVKHREQFDLVATSGGWLVAQFQVA